MNGRGPYAAQELSTASQSKYSSANAKRSFEIAMSEGGDDVKEEERPTPSYRKYPADHPGFGKVDFSNRSAAEDEILNDNVVSVHVCRDGGFKERGNCHEALMFQLEDQR